MSKATQPQKVGPGGGKHRIDGREVTEFGLGGGERCGDSIWLLCIYLCCVGASWVSAEVRRPGVGVVGVLVGEMREIRGGGDGEGRNFGWGEKTILDRRMYVNGRFRFDFPTALRAFISSRDMRHVEIYTNTSLRH
jgi:hypothetical protein